MILCYIYDQFLYLKLVTWARPSPGIFGLAKSHRPGWSACFKLNIVSDVISWLSALGNFPQGPAHALFSSVD
jgi:hypothetical protein